MTREELNKIPFRIVGHFNGDRMCSTYMDTQGIGIAICSSCRLTKTGKYGYSKRTYVYRNKEYRDIDSLLNAINENDNDTRTTDKDR